MKAQTQDSSEQNLQKTVSTSATDTSDPTNQQRSSVTIQQKNPKMLILGDSVTGILDRKRLAGASMDVTIRTHSGARLKAIENSVLDAKQNTLNDNSYETVLVHCGINNVSDADGPQSITEDYKDLLEAIQQVNSSAKLVVSSILPKKYDRLSLKVIKEVNSSLREYCDQKKHIFMDNTPVFMPEETVDKSLYRDEVHLNIKAAFAKI